MVQVENNLHPKTNLEYYKSTKHHAHKRCQETAKQGSGKRKRTVAKFLIRHSSRARERTCQRRDVQCLSDVCSRDVVERPADGGCDTLAACGQSEHVAAIGGQHGELVSCGGWRRSEESQKVSQCSRCRCRFREARTSDDGSNMLETVQSITRDTADWRLVSAEHSGWAE